MSDRSTLDSAPGPEVVVDGERFTYFGGTSYLGLHGDPEILAAAHTALDRHGIHTATSRTRFESPTCAAVERTAAEFFGVDDAFYYASGYAGNFIAVQALEGEFDAIFIDEHSHYCLAEAARLASCAVHRFPSRDADALAAVVTRELGDSGRPLVMSDGVFASFGWIAPLNEYLVALRGRRATVLIDDAHGVGCLGPQGRGVLDHLDLWPTPTDSDVQLVLTATTSKALGGFGGILPGRAEFITRARHASHYYDGASAPPAPVAAATARALELVRARPELRAALSRNVARARAGLRDLGIEVADLPTPIIGFTCGGAASMQNLELALRTRGILLPYASAYSGVGADGAMRLAIFATHTEAMIERLLDELRRLI